MRFCTLGKLILLSFPSPHLCQCTQKSLVSCHDTLSRLRSQSDEPQEQDWRNADGVEHKHEAQHINNFTVNVSRLDHLSGTVEAEDK